MMNEANSTHIPYATKTDAFTFEECPHQAHTPSKYVYLLKIL